MIRAVHRLIEGHVTTRGDAVAVVDDQRSCSYRELNAAANSLARRLMKNGFRRGMRADIRMDPSVDLAIVLLAVLKTGGCYAWNYADAPLLHPPTADESVVLLNASTVDGVCGASNLPVVTRETDIACVLDRAAAGRSISVPHATIVSLASCAAAGRLPWVGQSGAFDLWVPLLCGATAVVAHRQAVAA